MSARTLPSPFSHSFSRTARVSTTGLSRLGTQSEIYTFNNPHLFFFTDAVEYGVGPVADFNQAVATFEGNLTANNMVPPPFSVQGEQAWFIFSTDRNIPRKGFRITFSSGKIPT